MTPDQLAKLYDVRTWPEAGRDTLARLLREAIAKAKAAAK
jgi:hypothetical protein